MIIFGQKANQITSFDDWAEIFLSSKKKKHWKKGRSAYSIADFILDHSGEAYINSLVSETIDDSMELESAYIEKETRFDKYGHGREHDLGIFGKTGSGKSLFIGLEAKVDESFGEVILNNYLKAKVKELSGVRTNAAKRIEEIITDNFDSVDESVFDLRYQLFYSTVGTIAEEQDVSVLLILVFKTNHYDEIIGINNYRDYMEFMIKAGAKEIDSPRKNTTVHEKEVRGKELVCIYHTVKL